MTEEYPPLPADAVALLRALKFPFPKKVQTDEAAVALEAEAA